jgi:flagellar biosynthesis protein FlhB
VSTAKTEPPTPQRLRELRRKGEVPISRELDKTAALLGALAALMLMAPGTIRSLVQATRAALAGDLGVDAAMVAFGALTARAALTVALVAAVAAVASGAVQTGLMFSPGRILPAPDRLTPGKSWMARFRLETAVGGTIALIAALLGGAAAAVGVRELMTSASALVDLAASDGAIAVAAVVADGIAATATIWLGIALVIALVDAVWQRSAFMRRNRMSLQEIRDEYKRSEGDPAHKARRAKAHRDLLASSIPDGVKRADVIVANPVRIAVGLRFRPEEVDAPTVTVVGRGATAKAIRREAARRRVPVYEERQVARALVDLEVGDEVPHTLFEPVAVVFRWIARSSGEAGAER